MAVPATSARAAAVIDRMLAGYPTVGAAPKKRLSINRHYRRPWTQLAHGVMLDPEALAGRTILLATDDMFTGEYVRECLCGSGARVIGPVRTSGELDMLVQGGEHFDCGLISSVLNGQDTTDFIVGVQTDAVPVVVMLKRGQPLAAALSTLPSLSAPFGGFQAVDEAAAAIGAGRQAGGGRVPVQR